MARRAVITGIGAVTPLGTRVADVCRRLDAGESAVGAISAFEARGFATGVAAEVRDFDARPHFPAPKAIKLTDRPARFAVAAAGMALEDARWTGLREDLGVLLGTFASDMQLGDLAGAIGPEAHLVADVPHFAERVLRGLSPLWLLVNLPNMASAHVAIQFGATGPNSTLMTGWIAGSQAIGEACGWIRAGEADAVLSGGAASAVTPLMLADYEQAGLLGPATPDWPFVPGEAAAVFVVEERERARRRGAPIRAEIVGYACQAVSPGGSPTPGSAVARTLAAALREAGWTPADVDAVLAAAAPGRRAAEEWALAQVFGSRDVRRVRPSRAALGFPLAAAGPLDLALALASTRATPDPPAGPTRWLANAIGWAGQAVTLAIQVECNGCPPGGVG